MQKGKKKDYEIKPDVDCNLGSLMSNFVKAGRLKPNPITTSL